MELIEYLGKDARCLRPSGSCLSQKIIDDQVIEYYQLILNDLEPVSAIYVYPVKKEGTFACCDLSAFTWG